MSQLEWDCLSLLDLNWRSDWFIETPDGLDRLEMLKLYNPMEHPSTGVSVAYDWLDRYEAERTRLSSR